jgi:rRNA maturation endonuclease Nob1
MSSLNSEAWRTDGWDNLALVSPIDPKVSQIHGNDAVARVKLTHPDQTKVRKVRAAIRVTLRQLSQVRQVVVAIECEFDQSISHHVENGFDAFQIEGGFG